MRRIIPIVLVAAIVAGLVLKDRLFSRFAAPQIYLGYVEAETTLIASPIAGRLVARPVQRGDQVTRGTPLLQLDPVAADAEVERTSATVAEAKAQLENLRTGKRDIEQEIVRAQRREAEAALRLAELDLARTSQLVTNGTVSRVRFDQATSQVEQLRAKVEQMRALEASGDLGGRSREIEAGEAKVKEATASLAQAASRRADLAPISPVDALVENTFFDVGEWVTAGQPVVSLLAPDKLKLRFFVPEDQVALARPGATVTFNCDGCGGRQKATITYVSPRAEFTPPVIYSENARRKLVFMVEAKLAEPNARLRTGLPVEVEQMTSATP
jgi:HlyD family secretion protein